MGTEVNRGFRYDLGLSYLEDNSVMRLPDWACWLMDLGRWLGKERQPGKVARAAISVPTRGYAAAFAAMGIISGSFQIPTLTRQDRLKMLLNIERGTPVRYIKPGKELRVSYGKFDGVQSDPFGGKGKFAWIDEGNNKRYARSAGGFRYLDVAEEEKVFTRERPIGGTAKFVKACTGVIDEISYEFFSRLECVLVGNKRTLGDDLRLELQAQGVRGELADLLRVHEENPKDGYRCRLISFTADPSATHLEEPFGGVVLDGARAVLRWKGTVGSSPWLAVIDRTDPSAQAAQEEILAGLATSLQDADPKVGDPPEGIEALCYWDRKR